MEGYRLGLGALYDMLRNPIFWPSLAQSLFKLGWLGLTLGLEVGIAVTLEIGRWYTLMTPSWYVPSYPKKNKNKKIMICPLCPPSLCNCSACERLSCVFHGGKVRWISNLDLWLFRIRGQCVWKDYIELKWAKKGAFFRWVHFREFPLFNRKSY